MSAAAGTTGKQGGWNAEVSDAEAIAREIEIRAEDVILRTSVHAAKVKDKDSPDRVLVYIPVFGLDANNPDHWFWALPGGPRFAELPEKDDDVFIFFESGDYNKPRWMWGGQEFKADPDTGEIKPV